MTIERLPENPSIKHMTSIIIEIQQRNAQQIRETHTSPEAAHFHNWLEKQLKNLEEELIVLDQPQKSSSRSDLRDMIHNQLHKERDLLDRNTILRDRRNFNDL